MENSILRVDLDKEAIPSLIKATARPEGQCPFKTVKLMKILTNKISKKNLLEGICEISDTQEFQELTNPTLIFTQILALNKHRKEIFKAISEAVEEIDDRLKLTTPLKWTYDSNFNTIELLDRYAENITKSLNKIDTHYYCMKTYEETVFIGKVKLSLNPNIERLKLLCKNCYLNLNWKIINWKLVSCSHAIVFRKRYNKCLNCRKVVVKFTEIINCVNCVEKLKDKREVFKRGFINF